MKKIFSIAMAAIVLSVSVINNSVKAFATEDVKEICGIAYDLDVDDGYDIGKTKDGLFGPNRIYVNGDIEKIEKFEDYYKIAVKSGNLTIKISEDSKPFLTKKEKEENWTIVDDKSKVVDSLKLKEKVGTGTVVIQVSKDGKTWINKFAETDIQNKVDTINKQEINGEKINGLYNTNNVQLVNGCYYRIIVAYKMEHEIEPTKILFVNKRNKEEKERIEIYKFYVFDPSVNSYEKLDKESSFEFCETFRVDSQDGFDKSTAIKSGDPHIDWNVGKFYVSGFTDVRINDDVPTFLKVPGDKASLWFNLEQELDRCNGNVDIKVNSIESGSDIYFGTPRISDIGKGMLIVRKTNKKNKKERQIYTDYLNASASVGTNTRIDLFEEGDYEVALDYQLHYDKDFVFNTKTSKTLTYRMFFRFKVRNGDIPLFLRDSETGEFITNGGLAKNGFFIDLANSQYLSTTIKRELLSESLDGLIEDVKFVGTAKEGRNYTEEGVYTVTVNNDATNEKITKKVYVGDNKVIKAHIVTGLPISEISDRVEKGISIIDDCGRMNNIAENDIAIEESIANLDEKIVEEQDNKTNVGDHNTQTESKDINDNSEQTNNMWVFGFLVLIVIATVYKAFKNKGNKKI